MGAMANPAKPRRYPRVPLQPGPWVAVRGPGRTETYHCTSLGLGGVFLACNNPFPEGTLVRFALQVGEHTVRGIANVRDVTPSGMGLAFTSLSVNDRAVLHAYIDKQAEGAGAARAPALPSPGAGRGVKKGLDK
jgi:hypothetical protein